MVAASGPARAIDGMMEVEKRIIRMAEERNVHGLRFEWNDDLDFGHLLDPVPLNVFAVGGKSAETEFSQAELARVLAGPDVATDTKIHRIVQTLAGED
ncbi:MAG TPA: hypothetical protein VGQ93_09555 [Lysobacter sp.]|nr:hypothetical protein [Lysobacter sp.]